jgi:hypothetical protein
LDFVSRFTSKALDFKSLNYVSHFLGLAFSKTKDKSNWDIQLIGGNCLGFSAFLSRFFSGDGFDSGHGGTTCTM